MKMNHSVKLLATIILILSLLIIIITRSDKSIALKSELVIQEIADLKDLLEKKS